METYIGPMTNAVINELSKEIKKKKIQDKIIKDIINPILSGITDRYYPHLMGVTVTLTIIIVLLLSILCINIYSSKCKVCSQKL